MEGSSRVVSGVGLPRTIGGEIVKKRVKRGGEI